MVACYRGKVPNTSKMVCGRPLTNRPKCQGMAKRWEAG